MERWQTHEQIIPKALCALASCADVLAVPGWCDSGVRVRLLTAPVIAVAWLHWFTREPRFDLTKGRRTALMWNVIWDGSIHFTFSFSYFGSYSNSLLHLFFPLHSSKMHERSESPCCGKHLAKFCYCVCQQSVFCFCFFLVSFQITLFLFTFHILNTPVLKITSVLTILFLHCEYAA